MVGVEETFPASSPTIPPATSMFANKVSCSTPTSAEGGLPTSITNYPDENTIVTSTKHITLKPYEQTYGVHGGNVTDSSPDASVPYVSRICSTPPTTNQRFRRHDHKCEGGFPAYYQNLDCATEVHMASSFQADQTPIRDVTSLSAQAMSASSPVLPLFSQTGIVLQCHERLTTSTTAGNMNIWHTGNEHTTPSTSQSPSDLIPQAHTTDLINLLVCANVYVLHSNDQNTISSVTCSFQSPCDNMLRTTASETEKNIISEYYQRCFGDDLPESLKNNQDK